MPQSTSHSIPDIAQLQAHKTRSSREYPSDKGGKFSLCGRENRKWMCESVRPSLGTSMIVFAVPLLLPGITLTAVGFDDDSSFAKYGALHFIGIILLSLSGLLMLTGIFLNIRFHDKVSPEDAEIQLVSTHETKVTGSEQSQDMTVVSLDHKEEPSPNPTVLVSFMVDAGHSSVRQGAHHFSFGASQVGAKSTLSSEKMLEENNPDLAKSATTSHDFQSSLSSPRNKSLDSPGSRHFDFAPDTTPPEPATATANTNHLLNKQRENHDDEEAEKNLPLSATTLPHIHRKLPEITLKRPDSQSVMLVDTGPTEGTSLDIVSDLGPEKRRSSKKSKRKKKKRRDGRLIRTEDDHELHEVNDASTTLHFSGEDPAGFLSIDKTLSVSTHTLDNPIRDDSRLAYSSNIGFSNQQQVDLLSIPKTVHRVTDKNDSNDKDNEYIFELHNSASSVEEDKEIENEVKKLPKMRRQRRTPSSLPSVPPPPYSSLEDSTVSDMQASIFNSVGTVTQQYSLDASHSSNDKS